MAKQSQQERKKTRKEEERAWRRFCERPSRKKTQIFEFFFS
jgi:hypothetical protein